MSTTEQHPHTTPELTATVRTGRTREERLWRLLPPALFVVLLALLSVFVPYFFSVNNFVSVLQQSSALGLMAIGFTTVLLGGGMDLSVPALMGFSGVLGAEFMKSGGSPVIAVVIMISTGIAGGFINGLSVAYLRMIPFVVTLASMAIYNGASLWITNAVSVTGIPMSFLNTVMHNVWIFPAPILLFALTALVAQTVLKRTYYGEWLYAVGTNQRASRVAGVPTDKVLLGTYVVSGLMAGLAAVVTTAWLGTAGGTIGQPSVVLDVLSACVLGGVSIYGGAGTALGAFIGAILVVLIGNSLSFMQASYYVTLIVKGIVIIAIVAVQSMFPKD